MHVRQLNATCIFAPLSKHTRTMAASQLLQAPSRIRGASYSQVRRRP